SALDAQINGLITSDGHARIAMLTGTRADLDGREVLMLEFRDVTETRRVEEALRQTEARLRRVVAARPLVLFALDPEGRFTVSEGPGLARPGHESAEGVGQSAFGLYPEHPEIP